VYIGAAILSRPLEAGEMAILSSILTRSAYNGKGSMNISEDRICRLEAIGFKWSLRVPADVKEEGPVFNLDDSDDDFGNGLMDRLKSNKNNTLHY